MHADFRALADQATDPRWTPKQQRFLRHLATALPAAQPRPVNVRVWESESASFVGYARPRGRVLNVAFEHPDERLWHVELVMGDAQNFQVWLIRRDDTHLDAITSPERFVDDLMSGSLAFTVSHYAGRVSRIEANHSDIGTSFLVPPSNVPLRTRISTRRRSTVLRWTQPQPS